MNSRPAARKCSKTSRAGVGLLEEAEFAARREAEQMVKTLGDFRTALAKIQAIHDEAWTKENFQIELTRALTTIENARMEWNSARLKLPVLAGENKPAAAAEKNSARPRAAFAGGNEFWPAMPHRPGADLAVAADCPGRAWHFPRPARAKVRLHGRQKA